MAKISGVLTDGAGNVINNCTIELYAKKTTSKVLTQTQAFQVTNNGSYTMNVLPCDYEVKLIINGFPPKRLGAIQVFSDSADGSLNDFLLNPSESEITPAILQQVIDARNHANKSAEKAADSERNSKTSETNAKVSANNAKTSETNAKNIANSVENLVANARSSAQSASESATIANNASTSAKSYSDSAKNSADSACSSATESSNSAQQSSNSANAAKASENNAKTSEQNAKKSADDAKNWASSIDTTNLIKKTDEESQSIDGALDVKILTEQDQRVYSPNNKPTADDVGSVPAVKSVVNGSPIYNIGNHIVVKDMVGDQRLMPFRRDELPFGWYFRNGDNYLLDSPQGRALNSLSANYKRDHNITIKTINGKQYINVPTAFAHDGRGYFERAVDGTTRQAGSVEGDAIRDIWGHFDTGVVDNHSNYARGAFFGTRAIYPENGAFQPKKDWHAWGYDFRASNVVPTANENRSINIGMTPTIYLGV
ncbi:MULTISPECIES: prophage tail fiber N-terminal domain-containing protein [unclassified Gilliamella]|uniref:prophage tail fiber N-terminal domain-containing protein n=1 Tax=unclassified Gilliamella TaxID=2685620 RepID=UPI00130BA63B|nr:MULTISPECIES: prophage tail fiber N-terminal domain-containing protein [unclassified Gilliamella]MWP48509.1 hypothetical protein [Gilliamella sp. Lep-s35]MWP68571.1 hypothetical protein [Gilliamella sp. Lep-s5]MWP76761.1 hypothetical protein [Gilliamella sp. Lep-s21]